MPLSISIDVSPPGWRTRLHERIDRARVWVHDLFSQRELPNYNRTREELGGVPWRKFDATGAWFVSSGSSPAYSSSDEESEATPDLSKRLPTRTLAVIAVALASLGIFLVAVLGSGHPEHAPVSNAVAPVVARVVASTAPLVRTPEPVPERRAIKTQKRLRQAKRPGKPKAKLRHI